MEFASQYINLSTGLLQKHLSSMATLLVKEKKKADLGPWCVSLLLKNTEIFLPTGEINGETMLFQGSIYFLSYHCFQGIPNLLSEEPANNSVLHTDFNSR